MQQHRRTSSRASSGSRRSSGATPPEAYDGGGYAQYNDAGYDQSEEMMQNPPGYPVRNDSVGSATKPKSKSRRKSNSSQDHNDGQYGHTPDGMMPGGPQGENWGQQGYADGTHQAGMQDLASGMANMNMDDRQENYGGDGQYYQQQGDQYGYGQGGQYPSDPNNDLYYGNSGMGDQGLSAMPPAPMTMRGGYSTANTSLPSPTGGPKSAPTRHRRKVSNASANLSPTSGAGPNAFASNRPPAHQPQAGMRGGAGGAGPGGGYGAVQQQWSQDGYGQGQMAAQGQISGQVDRTSQGSRPSSRGSQRSLGKQNSQNSPTDREGGQGWSENDVTGGKGSGGAGGGAQGGGGGGGRVVASDDEKVKHGKKGRQVVKVRVRVRRKTSSINM